MFTSVTNDNIAHLAVTLKSVSEHLSNDCTVDMRVMVSDLAAYNQRKLRHMNLDNVEITIVDLNSRVEDYRRDFEERLGNFLGEESFYPFFIADMCPRLTRAMYIACGTVIRDDVEKLYHTELGDDIIGGVKSSDEFDDKLSAYRERWVGVNSYEYIDCSILLINLALFRKYRILNRFTRLIMGYNFDTVSAAGDYMNFLCKGRARMLNDAWRIEGKTANADGVAVFAPYRRPWQHVNMPYADEFWDTARRTPFYCDVREAYFEFNEQEKATESRYVQEMLAHAELLADSRGGFCDVLGDNYLIESVRI